MGSKGELREAEGGTMQEGGMQPCIVSLVHDVARAQPMSSHGFKHGKHHDAQTAPPVAHLMSVSRLSPSTSNTMHTWRPCGPACSNQSIMRQQ